MRRLSVHLSILVLAQLVACGWLGDETPPPGYSGPVPSARGQAVLLELQGRTFSDETGALGGGEWSIGGFGVVPNPVTGKGPVVTLRQGAEVVYLPVEFQGDVADLYRRVTGRESPLMAGEDRKLGESYRRALKLD